MEQLKGKVVVIIGASEGIGKQLQEDERKIGQRGACSKK